MKITKYNLLLLEEKPSLVKESCCNYAGEIPLTSPELIVGLMNEVYSAKNLAEEYVWMLAFDTKNNPLGLFEISHGSVNASIITSREVFIRLCLVGAVSFAIVHNHPSKNCFPSKEDVLITRKLKEASKMMDIKLLDHLIIGGDNFFSFAETKEI